MNLSPNNQVNLYHYNKEFTELIKLHQKKILPNKILLSGPKGIGKSTIAYHLVNYILSFDEEFSYDLDNLRIDPNNKSFKLVLNKTNPNFTLVDIDIEKKNIDIKQIRELITNLNKSSFNDKPRFVLIDNIEFLSLNSINALLKTLEEPSENIYFILINNNSKNLLPTIKSRCLNFRISLSNKNFTNILNTLLNDDFSNYISSDLINYYSTPGKIFELIKFSKENKIDLKNFDLKSFILLLINERYYKKNEFINKIIYDYIEFFLVKKHNFFNLKFFNIFLKKIHEMKKFNLDEELLLIEFKSKILNG
jgi:DNA polymerase-3 subunit delta'